jgi:tetratricopeptide (TPR) repeat protein
MQNNCKDEQIRSNWLDAVTILGKSFNFDGYDHEALDIFTEAFKTPHLMREEKATLNLQIGLTYLYLNDIDKAEECYQLSLKPKTSPSTEESRHDRMLLSSCKTILMELKGTKKLLLNSDLQGFLVIQATQEFCKPSANLFIENAKSCMKQHEYEKALLTFETALMIYENMSKNVDSYKEMVRIHIANCKIKLGKLDEALEIFNQIVETPNGEKLVDNRMKGVRLSQMFCQYKLGLTNKFKNKFSQVMKDISTNPDPESEDYQSAKCDGTIANKSDVILYKIGNFLCNAYSLEQGKLFEMHLDTVIKTQSEKRSLTNYQQILPTDTNHIIMLGT